MHEKFSRVLPGMFQGGEAKVRSRTESGSCRSSSLPAASAFDQQRRSCVAAGGRTGGCLRGRGQRRSQLRVAASPERPGIGGGVRAQCRRTREAARKSKRREVGQQGEIPRGWKSCMGDVARGHAVWVFV